MTAAATALNELTKEALARIFREEWKALLGRAWRNLRRVQEAEEAVQETAVKALEALDSLRDPERAAAWLFRTLEHECRDRLKRMRMLEERRAARSPEDRMPRPEGDEEILADAVAEAAEPYEAEDFREFVRREVGALPADLQVVVEREGMEGERIAALARELAVPWTTLASRRQLAFKMLRPRFARLMRGLQE